MSEFTQEPVIRGPSSVPREEFEQFVVSLTHEIRNRLSSISLEATNLVEEAGRPDDGAKLQQCIQECSAYLKTIRLTLAPEESHTKTIALSEFVKKLRERKSEE